MLYALQSSVCWSFLLLLLLVCFPIANMILMRFLKSDRKKGLLFELHTCNQVSEDHYPSYLWIQILLYESVILKKCRSFEFKAR